MFKNGEQVVHAKSGDVYEIINVPHPLAKMEYCNESFYMYRKPTTGDNIVWMRRQSEFEDGRFVKHGY